MVYPIAAFGGGGEVQQILLRTEGRENWDLGAVAPVSTEFANECDQKVAMHSGYGPYILLSVPKFAAVCCCLTVFSC
jgi:hypothetical protein